MDRFAEHTRAFVKVEDGCNRQLRLLRHPPRPRPGAQPGRSQHPAGDPHRLTDAGYKEIVLTAISLPSYGTDTGTSLVELVEKGRRGTRAWNACAWAAWTPTCCMRRGYRCGWRRVPKLCPQFHLSLQSGCDKTLRAMRRPYTTAQYAAIVPRSSAAAFGPENALSLHHRCDRRVPR